MIKLFLSLILIVFLGLSGWITYKIIPSSDNKVDFENLSVKQKRKLRKTFQKVLPAKRAPSRSIASVIEEAPVEVNEVSKEEQDDDVPDLLDVDESGEETYTKFYEYVEHNIHSFPEKTYSELNRYLRQNPSLDWEQKTKLIKLTLQAEVPAQNVISFYTRILDSFRNFGPPEGNFNSDPRFEAFSFMLKHLESSNIRIDEFNSSIQSMIDSQPSVDFRSALNDLYTGQYPELISL